MEIVSVKIADLTGPALDWAVATITKAWETAHELFPTWTLDATFKGVDAINGHCILLPNNPMRQDPQVYSPSTDWSHGGPLIERHGVSWMCVSKMAGISVSSGMNWAAWIGESGRSYGSTPLIAAMRAIVASKTNGDTIEVPAELAGGE